MEQVTLHNTFFFFTATVDLVSSSFIKEANVHSDEVGWGEGGGETKRTLYNVE